MFVSGNADPEVKRAALNAGGCDYVVKSLAGRQLIDAIKLAMGFAQPSPSSRRCRKCIAERLPAARTLRAVISSAVRVVLAAVIAGLLSATSAAQQHEGTTIAAVTVTGLRHIKEAVVLEQIESRPGCRTGRPWPTTIAFDSIGLECSATSR